MATAVSFIHSFIRSLSHLPLSVLRLPGCQCVCVFLCVWASGSGRVRLRLWTQSLTVDSPRARRAATQHARNIHFKA